MPNKNSIKAKPGAALVTGVVALMIMFTLAAGTNRDTEAAPVSGAGGDPKPPVSEPNGSAQPTTRQPGPVDHGPHRRHTDDRLAPAKPMSVMHFVKPVRYRANSGESLAVSLTLVAAEDVNDVTVAAKAETGLILQPKALHEVGSLEAGREVTVTFDVTTLAEGRRYVNVVAAADTESGRRMSSYSIPIDVGDVNNANSPKTASRVVTDDQGNRLILMRAETPKKGEKLR